MKKRFASMLLALVLVVSTFAGCSGSSTSSPTPAPSATAASAPQKLKSFSLGHLNSTAHLLAFVAKEEGFFQQEGLDVSLVLFSSAAELVSGLESKKLNAAFIGSIPTLVNQSNSHDISIFGGAMTNGHGYVIKSKYTQGLSKWDITILKGKKVATVVNSIQDLELQILLKKAGLTFSKDPATKPDVTLVYFASQTEAYNSLANNEIDAASTYSPYTSVAKAAGHSIVYYCSDQEDFKNQPCCRQVALTSALKESPDTYVAFERALLKAYKFSQENKAKTIQDVKKYINIETSQIEFEVYGGYAQSNPDPDKQATLALYKQASDFGYFKAYNIESLYNIDIYKKALDSIVKDNPNDAVYKAQLEHFNKYQ